MNNQPEVMTTHQKIQEAHRRNSAEFTGEAARLRTAQHVATSDIDQIKMVLQALMDKLEGLNLYVRSLHASSSIGKMKPMTEAMKDNNVWPNAEPGQMLLAKEVMKDVKLIEGEVDDNTSDSA